MYCEDCHKQPCKCSEKTKSGRVPLCEWKDARGCMCGKEYKFTVPIPGQSPLRAPSLGGINWQRLCEDHYDYERPDAWHDDKLEAHKEKIEAKYGKFSEHCGKNMQIHCMGIISKITGNNKLANLLMSRTKKIVMTL